MSFKKPFKLDDNFTGMSFDITEPHAAKAEDGRITVEQGLAIVLNQLKALGRRPRTIESYDYIFTKFIESSEIEYVDELNAELFYHYIESLDVALSTKLIRVKTIKAVLSRMLQNKLIAYNFWEGVQVSVDKSVKESTEENDLLLLLNLIDKTTFVGYRDACAILLIYRTGLRLNTIGQLRESHVNFDTLELILDGRIMKGRDMLKLPIDHQVADNLRQLIKANDEVRSFKGTNNDYLFITARGDSIINNEIHTNVISKQLSKYAKEYGLKNISAHAIRRAFAKRLLNQGASVPLISKALGHKDLSTTTRYLHLDADEVSNNLRDYL